MELAMRSATALSTGNPATSAIAAISFPVGLVMPRCSLARPFLVSRLARRAAMARSRDGHVARCLVAHCIEPGEFWRGFCAERLRERTSGVEAAAGGWIDRIGRIARD